MSKMGLPNFTGEVSLYKTTGHYRMAYAFRTASGAIHPAKQACKTPGKPLGGCIHHVSDEGTPCSVPYCSPERYIEYRPCPCVP